jgi:valyl-tRNA synthetase
LPSQEDRKPEACATFVGFNEFSEIDITSRRLPHWEQENATYFVTFRLDDSLPAEKLRDFENERAHWRASHPEPWSQADKAEYYESFSKRIEEWLDAGYGACLLREARPAQIVADALKHFDNTRYKLGAWVVMPNHVHVLVTPKAGHHLSEILHSWKSFTAHQINAALQRSGEVWQHESYDHIVRNEESLHRISEYIERNPEMAGIKVAQASRLRTITEDRKPEARATIKVQIESPGADWTQDPDTLDTWFSSWLWAYETMDEETRKKFYPTSVLVTGPDIIFFWVARMIIAGLEFKPGKTKRIEDNIPFRDVFFTGIIRDHKGRKMSKSLGNSPDPLDLIGKYGADGLRFGLMRIAPTGSDIRFEEKQIEEGRNFATKLWNAARFRQMHGPSSGEPAIDHESLSIYSVEVLAHLNETIVDVEEAYREYKFNEVAQRLYDFFWSDYCDWYVEAAKTEIFGDDAAKKQSALAVMDQILSAVVRLLHPFMPHITEELWSILGFGKDSIQFALPPSSVELPASDSRKLVAAIYNAVQAGRNLRAQSRIPSNKKVRFVLRTPNETLRAELPTMARLLNAEGIALDSNYKAQPGVPVAATALGELFLLISETDKGAERDRLEKEIAKIEGELAKVTAKFSDSSFIEKAPPKVVEEHQRRKADFSERLAQLRRAREALD